MDTQGVQGQRRLPETLPLEENQILTVTKFSMASDQLLGIVLKHSLSRTAPGFLCGDEGTRRGSVQKQDGISSKPGATVLGHASILKSSIQKIFRPQFKLGVFSYIFCLENSSPRAGTLYLHQQRSTGHLGSSLLLPPRRHCFQPVHFHTARVVTAGGSPSRVPHGRPNLLCLGM